MVPLTPFDDGRLGGNLKCQQIVLRGLRARSDRLEYTNLFQITKKSAGTGKPLG